MLKIAAVGKKVSTTADERICNLMKRVLLFSFASLLCIADVAAQTNWTVRPEWVAAHERFLSSDILAGRGSASRDEQIAATYVAAQFESYGLKPAPGMSSYIQKAPVVRSRPDGKAVLSIAGITLHEEAQDLNLFFGIGTTAAGHLVRVKASELKDTKFASGSVVLIEGAHDVTSFLTGLNAIDQTTISLLLVAETPEMSAFYGRQGARKRSPIRLAEDQPTFQHKVILIREKALAQLKDIPADAPASLTVHDLAEGAQDATWNAVGYLPGSDPAAGTLLLTAHLDHLGIGKPIEGDSIYNGANDDASGTTAVLELARALASGARLKRSVLFVCYGAEESGMQGSRFFLRHMPVAISDLIANIEFEMIGNQDSSLPSGMLMMTGFERSNLGATLKAHGAKVGVDPYPEMHFFERSDNYVLAKQGVVAHTLSGWATVPTYHHPNDDFEHLDLKFMTQAIQSLIEPVRWLASGDFKPEWTSTGRPQ